MKDRTFLHSLNDAVEGFFYVIKNEKNMRVHFLFAFLLLLAAVVLGVSRVEWIVLSTTASLVLVAEMINTAIEETVDFVSTAKHPAARIIKHVSAGAVLVTAFNAVLVGFLVFSRYLSAWPLDFAAFRIRHAAWYISFISVLVVVFCVVLGKVFSHRGTPLRGGVISGHTAVVFSLWVAVFFSQTNALVTTITFLLAVMVARSRIQAKIHTLWEVIAGALLGSFVTFFLFQLFG